MIEKDLEKLEKYIADIENEESIEKAIAIYKKASLLSKQLEKQLENVEQEVFEVKDMKVAKDDSLDLELFK